MPAERPKWISEYVPEELATSAIFKFRIQSRGAVIEVDMLQDIDIDYENLEHQAERIPAQYAFWAAIYSEVRHNTAIIERQIKVRRGALTKELLAAAGTDVKPTDKQVAYLLEQDQKLDEIERAYMRLNRDTGKLYHMVEAVKLKAELIRTLAGFKRQERQEHH